MNVKLIKTKHIKANSYNANEMTKKGFEQLKRNISEEGFDDPPLVIKHGKNDYVVVDGEHRWKAAQELGIKEIPCRVRLATEYDEARRMKQTVRRNKIRGRLNSEKFNKLVDTMLEKKYITEETAAEELGFDDPDEFEWIREELREQLPTAAAKREFDKKSKEIQTVDGLTSLVERLLQKHEGELLANFLVIELDHGKNLWIKLDGRLLEKFELKGRECLEAGYTFDSVIVRLLSRTDIPAFVEKHKKKLISIEDELQSFDDYLIAQEP